MMIYLLLFVFLLLISFFYLKIAEKYNIIDQPNLRSSHSESVIRGGGIIIFISLLAGAINEQEINLYFYCGAVVIAVIGFLDDLFTVSRFVRLSAHLVAIAFLSLSVELNMPMGLIPILVIFGVGVINAYNFMDGINGISGFYGIVFLLTAFFINHTIVGFIPDSYLIFPLVSILVFGLYNFRTDARMFMGDVGSTTIAYLKLYIIALLISTTGDWSFVLLMTVYGIDSCFTIVLRLIRKENIFDAHRSHLYQILANEIGMNHLLVAFIYSMLQIVVNLVIVMNHVDYQFGFWYLFAIILLPTVLLYMVTRFSISVHLSSVNND